MKLANRISLFFLVAIAVVLAGFSGAIYGIVRAHLYRQLNERSLATLDRLGASIEMGQEGLEWEANDRNLNLGETGSNKSLLWGVFDSDGHLVDDPKDSASILVGGNDASRQRFIEREDVAWNGGLWRITRREIRSEARTNEVQTREEPATKRYARLVTVVGVSLAPIASQLRTLSLTLVGISVLVWLLAALLGGWLCRNALAPLTQMTDSISSISTADLSQRLVSAETGDELGELSRAFNQLLDRVQGSFERQRQFAADASHQLRTPLTAMLGQVDVALRRDRSSAEYHDTLESVREQAAHLSGIIEMLLFLAREGADVISRDCNRFELNDWLANHLQSWSHHPRYRDFQFEKDKSELWIKVHAGLLGQAIDNLIDNACKYSAPDSTIVVRIAHLNKAVTLAIEDSGYGISNSEVARVRDPFFRSDEVRRLGIGGAGLGLSVAQRIINALDSELAIESTLGRGSIVTISFPRQAESELHKSALTPRRRSYLPGGTPETALVEGSLNAPKM